MCPQTAMELKTFAEHQSLSGDIGHPQSGDIHQLFW